jgi:YebC/PmpR family DNA-binding regulatory protein
MSGHNKWSTIKHKKAATDAKRSKVWTKIIKEITVAARLHGGELGANPRLRTAVDKGRGANMPNDTIDRAIKKGTGELAGVTYEDVVYEGYGPGGVAVIVEATTDNRNRTVGEIRHMFEKFGGNMGASGSVAWMFKRRGVVQVPRGAADEDRIMELVLDAGGEDVAAAGEHWEIQTEPGALEPVKEALTKAGLTIESADVTLVPGTRVHLDEHKAESMLKFMQALEDEDDVSNVHANFDIDDAVLERLSV